MLNARAFLDSRHGVLVPKPADGATDVEVAAYEAAVAEVVAVRAEAQALRHAAAAQRDAALAALDDSSAYESPPPPTDPMVMAERMEAERMEAQRSAAEQKKQQRRRELAKRKVPASMEDAHRQEERQKKQCCIEAAVVPDGLARQMGQPREHHMLPAIPPTMAAVRDGGALPTIADGLRLEQTEAPSEVQAEDVTAETSAEEAVDALAKEAAEGVTAMDTCLAATAITAEAMEMRYVWEGDRVRVWWDMSAREYYDGTVVETKWALANRGRGTELQFRVRFDDGETEWLDADDEGFRVLPRQSEWKAAAATALPPASLGSQRNPMELEPHAGARALPLREISEADQARFLPQYRLGLPITLTKQAGVLLRKKLGRELYRPRGAVSQDMQLHVHKTLHVSDVEEIKRRVSWVRLHAALDGQVNLGDGVGDVEPCAIRDAEDPALAPPNELSFGAFATRDLEAHALLDASGPLLLYRGEIKTEEEYNEQVDEDAVCA